MNIFRKIGKVISGKKGQSNPGSFTAVAARSESGGGRGGTLIVIFALILFLWDMVVGYKGFNITNLGSFLGLFEFIKSFVYVVLLASFFYFFTAKDKSSRALISFGAVLVILIITFALMFGFDGTPVTHVLFILGFWVLFVRQREDAATANWILVLFLFADLYLYSILALISTTAASYLIGVPILFYLTLGFVYERTNNTLAKILIFGVLGYYVLTAGPALSAGLSEAGIDVERAEIPPWREIPGLAYDRLIDGPITRISEGSNAWLSGRLEYAVTGKVEDYENEPVGVYLDRVQTEKTTKYWADEDVVLISSLRARTIDDSISVKVGCFAKDGKNKKDADKIDPNRNFPIFGEEIKDFFCTFNKGTLKEGSNSIISFADFNFETEAKQLVYFMDSSTLRKLTSPQNSIDPYDYAKIKDKNPTSRFTNGPIEVEIGVGGYGGGKLVGVSETYIAHPTFTINLKNNVGWKGKLKKIKELIILTPEGVELLGTEGGKCDVRPYSISDCENSIDELVRKPCLDTCAGLGEGSGNCNEQCEFSYENGREECSLLFTELGKSYTGHSVILKENRRDEYQSSLSIFETFTCRFKPTARVLDQTGAPREFIRLKARYDYIVEKTLSVTVQKVPEEEKKIPKEVTGDKSVNPPTELRIFTVGSDLVVEWELSADDGKGENDVVVYNIYRKKKGEEFKLITAEPFGTRKFVDGDIESGFDYSYKIEAVDDGGNINSVEGSYTNG